MMLMPYVDWFSRSSTTIYRAPQTKKKKNDVSMCVAYMPDLFFCLVSAEI